MTVEHNDDGAPEANTVGVVQVIFLTAKDIEDLGACDINNDIGRPGNRKWMENEVSLDGCALPINFVLQFEAVCPDLRHVKSVRAALGVSDRVIKNWRSGSTNTNYAEKYLLPAFCENINTVVERFADENGFKLVPIEELKKKS